MSIYESYADPIDVAIAEVETELRKATKKFGAFNSSHEGYAVILEELDELKEHVWMNNSKRDLLAMRKEAVQLAAMALRFIVDVCNEEAYKK